MVVKFKNELISYVDFLEIISERKNRYRLVDANRNKVTYPKSKPKPKSKTKLKASNR